MTDRKDSASGLGIVGYDAYEFVVADLGTPQGRAFARRHGIVAGQVLFLQPDGQARRATAIPADAPALRALLDRQLAAME